MGTRHSLALVLVTIALGASAGCDDKPAAPSGPGAVFDAWKSAGLTVSTLTASAPLAGGECRAGSANGVEVTLCTFADDKTATGAQPAGLAVIGDATGASLAQGSMLLVVADRRKTDPTGKTINQLTKVFRGRT
jgi:hypothetical protein